MGKEWMFNTKIYSFEDFEFIGQNAQTVQVTTDRKKFLLVGEKELKDFISTCLTVAQEEVIATKPSLLPSKPMASKNQAVLIPQEPKKSTFESLFPGDSPLANMSDTLKKQLEKIQDSPSKENIAAAQTTVQLVNAYTGLIKTAIQVKTLTEK